MPLPPIVGHRDARARLTEAVRSGRLPQVLMISGPAGIGKQRLALWLAQLVLCERREAEPCGHCRPCRLVDGLAFADLHWFVPIPRPKAADPEKATEEAAQAIAEVMGERRAKPLYGAADGMASHSMASVRLLHQRASLTSVEGGARIFILGDAERLVPQESSQEAANALLKLLEEPPAGSLFLLTTVDPRRLLPTIRSRAVPVRLQRLSDAEVREFLAQAEPGLAPTTLDQRVAAAAGSIGDAVAGAEDSGKAQVAAEQLLAAVLAGPGAIYERALMQAPYSARGEFTAMLDALADTLGEAARGVLGQPTRRPVPPALLRRDDPASLLEAMGRVAEAREAAYGNVNPQILLAVLGEELAEVL
ncbi:MAG: DNA polymerase III subunit [Gemmatimonadales bacterium]